MFPSLGMGSGKNIVAHIIRRHGMGKLPEAGDVITSQKFAYGYYECENRTGIITIDGKTTTLPRQIPVSEETRVAMAARTHAIPPKHIGIDLGAYDADRGRAYFIVEEARLSGGGDDGRGCNYPDGWHITARRLTPGSSYDPEGEVIQFYMTGDFCCKVMLSDVRIAGKMKKHYVWA